MALDAGDAADGSRHVTTGGALGGQLEMVGSVREGSERTRLDWIGWIELFFTEKYSRNIFNGKNISSEMIKQCLNLILKIIQK